MFTMPISLCIEAAIQSKEYAELCRKYVLDKNFTDITCFPNPHMDERLLGVSDSTGVDTASNRCANANIPSDCECSTGYCGCPVLFRRAATRGPGVHVQAVLVLIWRYKAVPRLFANPPRQLAYACWVARLPGLPMTSRDDSLLASSCWTFGRSG